LITNSKSDYVIGTYYVEHWNNIIIHYISYRITN